MNDPLASAPVNFGSAPVTSRQFIPSCVGLDPQ